MSNTFFAGLESFMEDAPETQTEEISSPESVSAEQAEQEVAEAQEITDQIENNNAEGEQIVQQAEMVFSKFDELDRMAAHIEKYGVDKAFLFFCNHDNILGEAFNVRLPGYESFNTVGDPTSVESIAALESIKEVAVKVWEFIKRLVLNLASWIVNLIAGYTRKCKKIDEHASKLGNMLKSISASSVSADDEVMYVDPHVFANGIATLKDAFSQFSKIAQAVCHEVPAASSNNAEPAEAESSEKPGKLRQLWSSLIDKLRALKERCSAWKAAREEKAEAKQLQNLRTKITLNKINKDTIETALKDVRANVKQVEVFVSQDLAVYRKQLSDIRVFIQTCEAKGRTDDAQLCRDLSQAIASALKAVNGSIGVSLKLIDDNMNIIAKWITAAEAEKKKE